MGSVLGGYIICVCLYILASLSVSKMSLLSVLPLEWELVGKYSASCCPYLKIVLWALPSLPPSLLLWMKCPYFCLKVVPSLEGFQLLFLAGPSCPLVSQILCFQPALLLSSHPRSIVLRSWRWGGGVFLSFHFLLLLPFLSSPSQLDFFCGDDHNNVIITIGHFLSVSGIVLWAFSYSFKLHSTLWNKCY